MPNGKHGDSPLSDFTIHGVRCFPDDIMEMLARVQELGQAPDRWPLGENWPYSPEEFEWAKGVRLGRARELLTHMISMLEQGRGDEVLVDPRTGKPIKSGS
jgi:hypothetical protein